MFTRLESNTAIAQYQNDFSERTFLKSWRFKQFQFFIRELQRLAVNLLKASSQPLRQDLLNQLELFRKDP